MWLQQVEAAGEKPRMTQVYNMQLKIIYDIALASDFAITSSMMRHNQNSNLTEKDGPVVSKKQHDTMDNVSRIATYG